jgi:hypothetical protein
MPEFSHISLTFSPLVPLWFLGLCALCGVGLAAVGLWRRARGVWVRLLALICLLAALSDPSLTNEQRMALADIVPVVVDVSPSQNLDGRMAQVEWARRAVADQLSALDVEPRFIEGGSAERGEDGTHLFTALREAIADVPPERIAGAIIISDGQVHDVVEAHDLGFDAPVHGLITGHEHERDRRIELVDAPRFGLVGKEQIFAVRVIDTQPDEKPIDLIVRRDGEEISHRRVLSGQLLRIAVGVQHAGANVIEFEVPVMEGELTALNNKLVTSLEGVRDKLRVLLVSGEPHAGERMWRNLLTADANVDLVHFTILRPPEKQDGTPINELSLIAFPTAELFGRRIREFDLIIFDRYSNQTILPPVYFENIVRYVQNGGALLMAVGPDYSGVDGLYYSPLGKIAPARPDGSVFEQAFRPHISELGARHPVMRGLQHVPWGRWFRQINGVILRGAGVMAGADERPLLVLSREDKGRVGLLLSDQIWLWARGFDGGGPYLDVLRRTSHWLMKEPELEEEALRASARGRVLDIERQTLRGVASPVVVTSPSGAQQNVEMREAEPGLMRAQIRVNELGLYRLHDDALSALVNVGADNPREFRDVVSTLEVLRPLAEATGGSVRRLANEQGALMLPRFVRMSDSAAYAGRDYIGLRRRGVSEVQGVSRVPLGIGLMGLIVLLGTVVLAWVWEIRRAKGSA